MPWAAAAMAIAGSVGEAVSQHQSMKAQEASHKYNAAASEQAAKDAMRDARAQANQERRAGDRLKGEQRAAYGASGAAVDTGSPLLAAIDQAGQLELAAVDRETAGVREGQAHKQAAQMHLAEARNVRQARRLATAGAIVGVGSSMFKAFGSNGGGMGGSGSGGGLQGSSMGGGMGSAAKRGK